MFHLSLLPKFQVTLLALCLVMWPVVAIAASADADQSKSQVKTNEPDIPVLNWTQRSDWLNVKSALNEETPGAAGDGVADDTAAIQATLDQIKTGATIYFPAGSYRITKSLVIGLGNNILGINILGTAETPPQKWSTTTVCLNLTRWVSTPHRLTI